MAYMGNKTKMVPYLVSEINAIIKVEGITTYIEPFFGSGAIGQRIRCATRIGSDYNRYLVAFYDYIRSGGVLPQTMSRELYEDIKYNKNDYCDWEVFYAGNVVTFNNKWFGGYVDKVSLSHGKERAHHVECAQYWKDNVKKCEGISINHRSYDYYSDVEGALIYCDPPYRNTAGYANDFNSEEFDDWVRMMSKKNIVIISEYAMPDDFVCLKEVRLNGGGMAKRREDGKRYNIEKVFMHREGLGIEYFLDEDI